MSKKPLLVTTSINLLLALFFAYELAVRGMVLWWLLTLIVLLALLGLYLMTQLAERDRASSMRSAFERTARPMLPAALVVIVGVIIFDYAVRQELRWSVYLGLLLPSVLLGILLNVRRFMTG